MAYIIEAVNKDQNKDRGTVRRRENGATTQMDSGAGKTAVRR